LQASVIFGAIIVLFLVWAIMREKLADYARAFGISADSPLLGHAAQAGASVGRAARGPMEPADAPEGSLPERPRRPLRPPRPRWGRT